jgi:hypothetical protein
MLFSSYGQCPYTQWFGLMPFRYVRPEYHIPLPNEKFIRIIATPQVMQLNVWKTSETNTTLPSYLLVRVFLIHVLILNSFVKFPYFNEFISNYGFVTCQKCALNLTFQRLLRTYCIQLKASYSDHVETTETRLTVLSWNSVRLCDLFYFEIKLLWRMPSSGIFLRVAPNLIKSLYLKPCIYNELHHI